MASHDPFPMRSEQARALAASLDEQLEGGGGTGTEDEQQSSGSWNKMGTSISSRLPKMFKKGDDNNSNKESLMAKKKKQQKTQQKNQKQEQLLVQWRKNLKILRQKRRGTEKAR